MLIGTHKNIGGDRMYTINVNGHRIWESAQIINGVDQLLMAAHYYNVSVDVNGHGEYADNIVLALNGSVIKRTEV